MGLRFRKSFGFGPFRATISKSGISTSVGVKGARITKRADGKTQTTVSIPGTGISHVSTTSSNSAPKALSEPAPVVKETRSKFEFISFYLHDTILKNSDGTKRQEILYRYKMRKPPFEESASFSISSDSETPAQAEILINEQTIGVVPEKDALFINENWDRLDCVSAIDVEGHKGDYDAKVHVRFFTKNDISEEKPSTPPIAAEEEFYPEQKKPGCLKGCLMAIGVFFLLFVVCLFSA